MAVLKFTNSKSSLKKIIEYITRAEKTEERLISGKDCMAGSAYDEMLIVKQMFGKNYGRDYIHVVQSFDIKDQVSYEMAHKIGQKLAELFTGFQVLLATHKDRRHVHNHLLINSVNFETGLKFQQSKEDMKNIKAISDCLCLEAGLSVIEHAGGEYVSRGEYKAAEKGESWKFRLINMLDNALEAAKTKEEFILYMELHGYGVKWTDSRYNITYTTPEGFKCRDNKLHDKKYTREAMEDGFRLDGSIQSFKQTGKESVYYGRCNTRDVFEIGQQRRRESAINIRNKKNVGKLHSGVDVGQYSIRRDQNLIRKLKQVIRSDDRSR